MATGFLCVGWLHVESHTRLTNIDCNADMQWAHRTPRYEYINENEAGKIVCEKGKMRNRMKRTETRENGKSTERRAQCKYAIEMMRTAAAVAPPNESEIFGPTHDECVCVRVLALFLNNSSFFLPPRWRLWKLKMKWKFLATPMRTWTILCEYECSVWLYALGAA